ncbi:MAG TPA: preprotein translocase subunit YajC [Bdellovibrionota bacterium]|nr:preprotein translocase subunit YajC [Bdellovibrionota bacterium]
MMINIAYAADAAPAPGSGIFSFLPLLLIIAVFYFLVFVPQRKRMKTHNNFLSKLKHGDRVVTASGIYGTVTGIAEKVVTVEIADEVRIKVAKPQIVGLASAE